MSRASELADRLIELYSSQGVTALAAEELRRLERVNAELVGALRDLEVMAERYRPPGYPVPDAQKKARAALTSATKEQQK